jgi:hypothetical protein
MSPTLLSMLSDKLLANGMPVSGYAAGLGHGGKGTARGDPSRPPGAALRIPLPAQQRRFRTALFRNILVGYDYYYKRGKIDLITSAATHAFLPPYQDAPQPFSPRSRLPSHSQDHLRKNSPGLLLPQFVGIRDGGNAGETTIFDIASLQPGERSWADPCRSTVPLPFEKSFGTQAVRARRGRPRRSGRKPKGNPPIRYTGIYTGKSATI